MRKLPGSMGSEDSLQALRGNNVHFSAPPAAEPFDLTWMADRFAGKPLAKACNTI